MLSRPPLAVACAPHVSARSSRRPPPRVSPALVARRARPPPGFARVLGVAVFSSWFITHFFQCIRYRNISDAPASGRLHTLAETDVNNTRNYAFSAGAGPHNRESVPAGCTRKSHCCGPARRIAQARRRTIVFFRVSLYPPNPNSCCRFLSGRDGVTLIAGEVAACSHSCVARCRGQGSSSCSAASR